ncbi:MAG: substrate-binding domain-containing protein [Planctomycetota bacterium]
MNPAARLLLLGAASLTALGLMLPGGASRSPHTTPDEAAELTIYCAASLRLPVEQIAQAYERECGVKPRIHYGGSNTLLSQIEVSRTGDLYLAADESFLRFGEQKGLVAEVSVLGQMRAVLAVPRGNPLAIASLDDLQTRRVAAGNPDQTAIGRTLCNQLQASGSWKPLERRVREAGVFKPTVNEVANDILLGSVDAGVVWDAIASQYPEIDIVEVPELQS